MEKSKRDQRSESKLKKTQALLELEGSKYSMDSGRESNDPDFAHKPGDGSGSNNCKKKKYSSNKMDCMLQQKSESMDIKMGKNRSEVIQDVKKIRRGREKQSMQRPKFFFAFDNLAPSGSVGNEPLQKNTLPPLYVLDLQHLLLYALQGNVTSFKPRWCRLLRVTKVPSVVVIFLNGVSYEDFNKDKESFKYITQTFQFHIEMVCPEQYNSSVDAEIYNVPLSVTQLRKVNHKVSDDVKRKVASKLKHHQLSHTKSKVPRMCLLLSSHQMMMEGYPMPVMTSEGQYSDFVFSKDSYTEVTHSSPLFALDCEMCLTTAKHNELARVSIVAENRCVIYDSLVKPRNKIINYLTRFSGITEDMMASVTKTLEDVQMDIKELLPGDAILCGQSLDNDLLALKMFHPYVIDTGVIYNMSGNRSIKAGLRKLTSFFLSRDIQNSKNGHCSAEDATATLDLVKLKLHKGLEFGDATATGVYFPNIETYFLGEENGKLAITENIESEDTGERGASSSNPESKLACDIISKSERDNKSSEVLDSSFSDSEESHVDGSKANTIPIKRKLDEEGRQISLFKRQKLESGENTAKVTWKGTKQQATIFTQQNSVHVPHSFFKLVHDAGRNGCMVGRHALTSKYEHDQIETVVASNDSEARKCSKLLAQTKDFLWTSFSEYEDALKSEQMTEERKQKLRRKLDNRVKSVLKNVKDDSLVVVMLTGRQQEDTLDNAGVFVTIK